MTDEKTNARGFTGTNFRLRSNSIVQVPQNTLTAHYFSIFSTYDGTVRKIFVILVFWYAKESAILGLQFLKTPWAYLIVVMSNNTHKTLMTIYIQQNT